MIYNSVIMIKRTILLLSASLLSLFVHAQIQRNFDGMILGKATKDEIVNYLTQKRIYPKEEYGGKTILAVGDISFGGVIWNATAYHLYNGVLSKIVYTKHFGGLVADRKEAEAMYRRLRNILLKKYTSRKLPSPYASIPDNLYLKGKNTTVEIKRDSHKGDYYVKLIYTDIELDKKAKKKDYDDL